MENVKVGIIGIGNMGSEHAKLISSGAIEGLTLCAVADRKEGRRIWAKDNLPNDIAVLVEGEDLIASGIL